MARYFLWRYGNTCTLWVAVCRPTKWIPIHWQVCSDCFNTHMRRMIMMYVGLLWGVTASACPVSNSAPPVNMLLHCFCDVLLTLPHNHGNIYELQIQCFQLLSTVPEELWKGVYEHAGVAAPDQLPLRVINFLKTCTYLLECELSHVQYAVSVTGSTTHETSTKATTRLVPLMVI